MMQHDKFTAMLRAEHATRPNEVFTHLLQDGTERLCMLKLVPNVRTDPGRVRRAAKVATTNGTIHGAKYELMICDSGCTEMLLPSNFAGKTLHTILVPGTARPPDTEFSTADPNAASLQPLLQGEFTGILASNAGDAWVIHWDVCYIMAATECQQPFFSPGATRKSWVNNGGFDQLASICGTPADSMLTVTWAGESGAPEPHIQGKFSCDVDEQGSTYYLKLHPIEALKVFTGDKILGDVARALKSIEHEFARAGINSDIFIQQWVAAGKPAEGRALVMAYSDAEAKSKKWDAQVTRDDHILRIGAQRGVCEFVGCSMTSHAYNWGARRDYSNPKREKELAKANNLRRLSIQAASLEDAVGGSFGAVLTTKGAVLGCLSGTTNTLGKETNTNPMYGNINHLKGISAETRTTSACVRVDCPCTASRTGRADDYCSYRCETRGACAGNYHRATEGERERETQLNETKALEEEAQAIMTRQNDAPVFRRGLA